MSKIIRLHLKRPVGACEYNRVILPFRHLYPSLKGQGIALDVAYGLSSREHVDAVIVHRIIPDDFVVHLLAQKAKSLKVGWDTDDDFTCIPDYSPLKLRQSDVDAFIATMMVADRRWCSTDVLSNRFSPAATLPNLIDMNEWMTGFVHPPAGEGIRILWSGSNTHDDDLKLIEKPLQVTMERYGNVILFVMGTCPKRWKGLFGDRLISVPWVPIDQYPAAMLTIRPHIGLAPLVSNRFNSAKSNIKYLDYTAAGAVTLASRLEPYRCGGENLYLAEPDDWTDLLSTLVRNEEIRKTIYSAAADDVKSRWTWQSDSRKLWMDAFMGLVEQV